MVARVLGKLLHMVGILPTDKVTEVQRTDLVGEFVGHTGPKTRRKVHLYRYILTFFVLNKIRIQGLWFPQFEELTKFLKTIMLMLSSYNTVSILKLCISLLSPV